MNPDFTEAMTEVKAALDECARLDLSALTAAEWRIVPGELPDVLADGLHISRGEAVHRILEADLG